MKTKTMKKQQLPETKQSIKIKQLKNKLKNEWKSQQINKLVEDVWGSLTI